MLETSNFAAMLKLTLKKTNKHTIFGPCVYNKSLYEFLFLCELAEKIVEAFRSVSISCGLECLGNLGKPQTTFSATKKLCLQTLILTQRTSLKFYEIVQEILFLIMFCIFLSKLITRVVIILKLLSIAVVSNLFVPALPCLVCFLNFYNNLIS